MPFIGQDWRSSGEVWLKDDHSSNWFPAKEIFPSNESIPRSHVKKIIGTFLYNRKQKQLRNSYTSLTTAPVSKCSARENMTWIQVGMKGSSECHGYSSLGEMIRRLDLQGAARNPARLSYIMRIAEIVIQYRLLSLSGSAQSRVFMLVESLLNQVMSTFQEIRAMHSLLDLLMATMQNQSKRGLFSSKECWFGYIDTVRKWKSQLRQIKLPQRLDRHLTLSDLPYELQEKIAMMLLNEEDVLSLQQVTTTLQHICSGEKIWRNLCYNNYKSFQIEQTETAYLKDLSENEESSVKTADDVKKTTEYWQYIYKQLSLHFDVKELDYIDPLYRCQLCNILYWKDTGHPCSRPDEKASKKLTPRQLVLMFE